MPAVYQVRLKDQAGALVAMFDAFDSLAYRRERNGAGWCRLALPLPDNRADLFELDGQVEVWRKGGWAGADWALEFEGYHRRKVFSQDGNGQEQFESWSEGYLARLAWRRIMRWKVGPFQGPVGTDFRVYHIQAGYLRYGIIGGFFHYEAGQGAIPERRLPGWTMFTTGPAGGRLYTRRYRGDMLLSVLKELAQDYELEIDAIGNGPAQVLFRVHPTSGTDRRVGNPAANPPLVFSQAYDNIATPSYTEGWLSEANAIWIAGTGDAETRLIHLAENGTRQAASPWNYREDWVDAADLDNIPSLRDRGYGELRKADAVRQLTFAILETDACKYGRDWVVSDLVTGRYRGISADYRIDAVEIGVDNSGVESITPDLVEYAS